MARPYRRRQGEEDDRDQTSQSRSPENRIHLIYQVPFVRRHRRAIFFISASAVLLLLLVLLLVLRTSSFSRAAFPSQHVKPTDLSHEDVLKSLSSGTIGTDRKLNGTVLAYVTPWNSKGYDMAKKYGTKLTHVSPVWYQLKRNDKGLSLTGGHDVDRGWMAEVRKRGTPLILPRVVVEGLSLEIMFVEREEKLKVIKLIIAECKEKVFDGIVLEAWTAWASFGIFENNHLRQKALEFVEELGTSMHRVRSLSSGRRLQLILVIPPLREDGWYHPEEFKRGDMDFLKHAVDSFSLMTYDYSNPRQPGPNAPLFWIRSAISNLLPTAKSGFRKEIAAKILMGINFYGNDFIIPRGGGPILGHEFLTLVKEHEPNLVWDMICGEHYFEYTKDARKHKVYYPTLTSVSLRLEESQAHGVGVSIWEIGQGLEEFFDLL